MSVLDTIAGWKEKAVKLEKAIQESLANHNFIAGQLDAAKAMIQELEMKFPPVAEEMEVASQAKEEAATAVEVAAEVIEAVV